MAYRSEVNYAAPWMLLLAMVSCRPGDVDVYVDPPPQASCATPLTSLAGQGAAQGASFTEVYRDLIMANGCAVGLCHTGMAGGLTLRTRELAYAGLVGVAAMGRSVAGSTAPSCADSGLLRVQPGDPDASLLIKKLEHTQPCGAGMPSDAQHVAPEVLLRARAWIATGARND